LRDLDEEDEVDSRKLQMERKLQQEDGDAVQQPPTTKDDELQSVTKDKCGRCGNVVLNQHRKGDCGARSHNLPCVKVFSIMLISYVF
jgi:ribosomal protein S27AE